MLDRGYNLAGRMTVGPFKHLPFTEQVQVVAQDLVEHFWSSHAQVVANSFGAYLFLHAQALLAPFPGRVLLLSPIVGDFEDESSGQHFSPPQPEKLKTLVQTGEYHRPDHCEIHVGEHDWQSNPYNVSALGVRLSLPVHVVPGNGHRLDPVYVGQVLDRWLQRPGGEPR